ncbi:acyl-CoA thioesterase domain-containing protein [Streptomyces sp. NPDC051940]|uniref:acyl-CoA thioesterase n=1 Tax=Streptomyces sp. NPDC051940 TaxID=3155675 RepID=UPI003444F744
MTWEELAAALEPEQTAPGRFTARPLDVGVGRVPGATLLGLAVVAAERRFPGRAVQTLHTVFPRGGKLDEPLGIAVDAVQEGRTLTTAQIVFAQRGREHCRSLAMLGPREADYLSHTTRAPEELPGPDACEPFTEPRLPFETLVERGPAALAGAAGRPAAVDVWLRCKEMAEGASPSRALLAHAMELFVVPPALRPYGAAERERRGGLGTRVVLSQSVTFHEDFTLRDWVLLRAENVHHGAGRLHTRLQAFCAGRLVASATADGLVRAAV